MRNSPLYYIWSGNELVNCVLSEETTAADTQPNQKELELVRVFKEYNESKKEIERLKEYEWMYKDLCK